MIDHSFQIIGTSSLFYLFARDTFFNLVLIVYFCLMSMQFYSSLNRSKCCGKGICTGEFNFHLLNTDSLIRAVYLLGY